MARYNHFGLNKYKQVRFDEIKVGEKFRMDKRGKDGRSRIDIVMIKTGSLSYMEQRTKKESTSLSSHFFVSSYSVKNV